MQGTLPRILAVVLAMLMPSVAFAQAELPADIATKSTLSSSDEQAVADWARTNWALVNAESPEAAREARRRLTEPLVRRDTSAAFRLAMDQGIGSELQQAINGSDVYRGVNAALLTGWLATDRAVRSLTSASSSDQVAIRFAAISGLSNAFRAAGFAPVAFEGQVGNEAVTALSDILTKADDRSILDASVKALIDAMAVPEAAIAGFGARSGERLTNAVGERMNTLPMDANLGARVTPLIRAMGEIRTAVTQRRGNIGASWQSAVMQMYGRAGALGFRYVRAERSGTIDAANAQSIRGTVRTALQVAQTTPTLLQLPQATQGRLSAANLVENFQRSTQDDGDGYRRAYTNLLGALENDFSLPRDRFNIGG
ncbi:MAG: hypothetical protein ACIAQU_02385 [Phycisphaerales bacterium JB064]